MKQKAVAATAVLPELTQGKFPEGDLLTWLAGIGDLSAHQRELHSPTHLHVDIETWPV